MKKYRFELNYIICMILAFLLGGIIHVVFYGVSFTYCIVQIYYGMIVSIWGLTVYMRIIDPRIRGLLIGMAGMEMFYFALQMGRYVLFQGNEKLLRYSWYGFYIPMIFIPVLFYLSTLLMNETRDYKIPIQSKMICTLAVVLTLLVMTNDLHKLFFTEKQGILNGDQHSFGIVYYVYLGGIAVILGLAFVQLIRKSKITKTKGLVAMPVLTMIVGMGFSLLCSISDIFLINKVRIWNLTECYIFTIIVCFEVCIAVGLIQSNTKYGKLICELNIPIEILPYGKKSSLETLAISNPDRIYRLDTMNIDGGSVRYAYDLTNVYELNRKNEEATEQIESRNEYLRLENELKEEQARLEKRNDLYDKISSIVRSELVSIEELLNKEDVPFLERSGEIAVLYAYVKRRSNLGLLREQEKTISLLELKLAIEESLDYLKLNQIEGAITLSGQQNYDLDAIIDAYDFFEKTIEKYLSSLTHIVVSIMANEKGLTLRMMMQLQKDGNNQEMLESFSFNKGGDNV